MSQLTDEEIAIMVQKGDTQSFGLIVERYEQKITRYARKFLYNNEDVKDIVQEVFIKTYANMQSFETDRKFSSWIYRIAHNEFINAAKKKSRERVSFIDLDVFFPYLASPDMADSEANNQDLRRVLDNYLEKLDIKYREPLVLYYFEQLDYKEIAEVLRIPASTVGVRLQRGKAILKKIVNQSGVKL